MCKCTCTRTHANTVICTCTCTLTCICTGCFRICNGISEKSITSSVCSAILTLLSYQSGIGKLVPMLQCVQVYMYAGEVGGDRGKDAEGGAQEGGGGGKLGIGRTEFLKYLYTIYCFKIFLCIKCCCVLYSFGGLHENTYM